MTSEGPKPIILRDFQKQIIEDYEKTKESYNISY